MSDTVTRRVDALAADLSARLLDAESAAFDRARRHLLDTAGAAGSVVSSAFRRVGDGVALANDARLTSGLAARHRDALEATRSVASDLIETAFDDALATITEELSEACAVLPASSAPHVTTAADTVAEQRDAVVAAHLEQFDAALPAILSAFRAEARRQVLAAAEHEPGDLDALTERLVSAKPVRRPSCSGASAWFRSCHPLNASLRAGSVATMNGVRLRALDAFNKAHA